MQPYNANGVPVVIMTQSVNLKPDKRLPYKRMKLQMVRSLIALGAVQIPVGIMAIILNLVALVTLSASGSLTQDIRLGGFCSGILFVITGSFGIVGGIKKGRCHVITFNVLSIISAVLAGFIIAEAIVLYSYNHFDERMILGMKFWFFLSIIGFLELVFAISSSVVCCKIGACFCDCDGVCCCPSTSDAPQIADIAHSADRESLPLLKLKKGDDQQPFTVEDLDSISTTGMSDIEVSIDSNPQIKVGPNQIKSVY